MPCSLCHHIGHNRRSATCPVNIANRNTRRPPAELRPRPTRTIMQQALATGPTGRIVSSSDTAYTRPPPYIQSTYETPNVVSSGTPQSTYETPNVVSSGIPQSTYETPNVVAATLCPGIQQLTEYMLLYKNMQCERQFEDPNGFRYKVYCLLVIPGQLPIPHLYIRPADNKVMLRRVPGYYTENGGRYCTAIGVRDGTGMRILNNSPLPKTSEQLYVFIPQIPGFNIPIDEPDVSARSIFINHIKQIKYEIFSDGETTNLPCNNTCAVCLDTKEHTHFVHTNCRHSYCAECVSAHIKTQHAKFVQMKNIPSNMVELPCPLCRTNITKLVFTDKTQHDIIQGVVL